MSGIGHCIVKWILWLTYYSVEEIIIIYVCLNEMTTCTIHKLERPDGNCKPKASLLFLKSGHIFAKDPFLGISPVSRLLKEVSKHLT